MGAHYAAIAFSVFLLFSSVYVAVESLRTEEEVKWLFEEWKLKQDKSYHGLADSKKRFEVFRTNLLFIDEHNRPENNHTYRLGLTCFADMTNQEYRSRYVPAPFNMSGMISADFADVPSPKQIHQQPRPASWDWRDAGVVTGVKNQGVCQSCWAFAAVATVESLNAIITRNLISISEQEIVDCNDEGNHCNPGLPQHAYDYILRNGGIDSDDHYPYVGVQQQCKIDKERVVTIDDHFRIPRNSEITMRLNVRRQPIFAALDAASWQFQLYQGGIYVGPCTAEANHAVAIIGYGIENRRNYWLAKNSWGINWGDGGYFKIERDYRGDARGRCAIAMWPRKPYKRIPDEAIAS